MSKPKELLGKKFGVLTVLEPTSQRYSSNGEILWKCQCDCGNIVLKRRYEIQQCRMVCGKNCLLKKANKKTTKSEKIIRSDLHANAKDITGQRFGKLVALYPTKERISNNVVWQCQCDCGNTHKAYTKLLLSGKVQSCGCLHSIGERNIQQILDQNNIEYIKEFKVKIFNQLRRFDFAIIKNNKVIRLIEFDGIQHFQKITSGYFSVELCEEIQQRDKEKNEYAKKHHIPLVRIPYMLRDSVSLQDLLGNKYLI